MPLTAQAVARLDELLRDPAESAHHAACLEVLGRAGGPGAFEAVRDYARRAPAGELSGAAYRARLALPLAWGALARRDARALEPLLALARDRGRAAGWRHRQIDAGCARRLERRLARGALARSGRRGAEIDALLAAPPARGEGASR